jgi:hypothetical protein
LDRSGGATSPRGDPVVSEPRSRRPEPGASRLDRQNPGVGDGPACAFPSPRADHYPPLRGTRFSVVRSTSCTQPALGPKSRSGAAARAERLSSEPVLGGPGPLRNHRAGRTTSRIDSCVQPGCPQRSDVSQEAGRSPSGQAQRDRRFQGPLADGDHVSDAATSLRQPLRGRKAHGPA